jgi:flagellar hook-length control protein FliK
MAISIVNTPVDAAIGSLLGGASNASAGDTGDASSGFDFASLFASQLLTATDALPTELPTMQSAAATLTQNLGSPPQATLADDGDDDSTASDLLTTLTSPQDDLASVLAQLGINAKPTSSSEQADSHRSTDTTTDDSSALGIATIPLAAAVTTTTTNAPEASATGTAIGDVLAGGGGKDLLTETAKLAAPTTATVDGSNFAQTMAAQQGMQSGASGQTSTQNAQIDTPVGNNDWNGKLSDQVVWMAKNNQQTAELKLNPPQLGPLQITINIQGDQASASFVSAHAEVRQAIENALPQLREMLAGAGISLGQTNVNSQSSQQQSASQQQAQNGNTTRFSNDNAILDGDTDSLAVASTTQYLRSGSGLVDLFA